MTTREQKLRELVNKWRDPGPNILMNWHTAKCADELAAVLDEEVVVSDEMVERACVAFNDGEVDWHEYSTWPEGVRKDMRAAITAALKEPGQ